MLKTGYRLPEPKLHRQTFAITYTGSRKWAYSSSSEQ